MGYLFGEKFGGKQMSLLLRTLQAWGFLTTELLHSVFGVFSV